MDLELVFSTAGSGVEHSWSRWEAQLGLTHVQERLCALKHQNSVKYCSARSGPGLKINHEGTQQTKQAESGGCSGCISCVENGN